MSSWFLERQGRLLGPYSLQQMQGLVASNQLGPADRVMREGDRELQLPTAVPELMALPEKVQAASLVDLLQPETATPRASRKKTLWLTGLAAALLVIFASIYWKSDSTESEDHLPEWFRRAHRIQSSYQTKKAATALPGIGLAGLPEEPAPAGFSATWFEENFTHYLEKNEFAFATPRVLKLDADGKILAGTKLLLGGYVDDLALVCICTPDARPVNMYLAKKSLRARSSGPPTGGE